MMKKSNYAAPLGRWTAGIGLAVLSAVGSAQAQGPTFVSLNPAPNINNAAPNGLTAQFGVAPPLGATAGQGLKVFSSQRGGQRAGHSGTVSGPSATQLQFVPAAGGGFLPGETVQVSLTSGIVASNGTGLTNPTVAQYTIATGGTGRGAFGLPPIAVLGSVATAPQPVYVKLADVDNDGDLDLLTCNDGSFPGFTSTVSLRVNNGTGIFTVPGGGAGTIAVGQNARCLAVGDIDNDGDIDLVTGNEASSDVSIRLNAGAGFFYDAGGARGTQATGLAVRGVALADVDADGDLDLLAAGGIVNAGVVNVYANDGSGLFLANGSVAVDGQTRNLTTADVDGDGDLDLLVACVNNGTVSVRLNNGAGVFSAPATNPDVAVGQGPVAVAAGDVDGDGDLDFVSADSFGNTASIRLNTFGTFAPPAANGTVAMGGFPFDLALGDIDADGDLDILSPSGNSSGGVSVRLNNGHGVFTAPTVPAYAEAVTGASSNGVALGDLDGDGDLDFVAANQYADNASIRLNGPGPEINVRLGTTNYLSGSTYSAGNLPVNGNAVGVTFTLENLSPTDVLHISGAAVAGGTGLISGFSVPSVPFQLAPGASTQISISLIAPGPGPQTAQFVISSDDPDQPGYVLNFTANGGSATPTAATWTGAVDTRWALAGNWNPAVVPDASADVTIPVVPNQPVVSAAGATCATLTAAVGTNLSVVPAGYLTATGNYQANGTTTMTGGTLEAKGAYVHFDGGLTATGGTVLLSGISVQEVGTVGGGCTFWNLTVATLGSNHARPYGGNLAVRRVLTLQNDLANGTVNLLSDATGTAMIVNAGGRVQMGGTMQRYIGGPNAGLGYRHLSAPSFSASVGSFQGQGVAPVLNANYNSIGNTVQPFPTFFGFDESRQGAAGVPGPVGFDQGWVSPAATTDALIAGRGYTCNLAGTASLVYSGYFITGGVAVGPLSRSGTGAFAGYHLLGNPYPSPIDWDNVTKPAGLDDAVYVFRSTSQYGGFYDSYVGGMGTLTGGEIAAMQGFFVRVSQPVASFGFTNAARLTSYSNPTFRRGAPDPRPALALALRPASGGEADKAFIYFEARATAAYDGRYDADKLPNPSGLNLASQLGAQEYAVNGLPLLGTTPLVLPLTVQVPTAGAYELAADQLVNFAPGTTLYLRDALLGTLTPLTASARYAFTLAGTSAPGRFSVEFRPAGTLASATQVLEAQVQVWPNPAVAGAGVTVAAPAGASVAVLNALGQTVRPAAVAGAAGLALPTAGLAAGLYVVRVRTAAGEVSRRLVVE